MRPVSADTAEGEFRVPEDVETGVEDETGSTDDAKPARDLSEVDISRTPGPVVGAVALGVVAAPLLGVYAVLFITRFFLKPGVSPDITSSWTGEGISGVIAAILAVAMLVVVARAAGGRGLPVFVGAQVVVVGTCAFLLSDTAYGGRSVTIVVLVLSVAAVVLALLPVSRLWFAAHAADRAGDS